MPLPPSLLLHNKKERAYKRLEILCSTCAMSLKSNSCAKEIEEQTKLYIRKEIREQKMTNSKCAKRLENPNKHKNKGKRHGWEFLIAFVFHHRAREYLEVTCIKKEWGFWCFCSLLIKFCRLELLLVLGCWDDQIWEVNV
jgi:hypothetical protein